MIRIILLLFTFAVSAIALSVHSGAGAQSRRPLRMNAEGMPYPETAASFDCHRASGVAERLICRDSGLAMLDGSLGELYPLLIRRLPAESLSRLRQSQRTWLARRNACRDRACLVNAYDGRLTELQRALDARERQLRAGVSRVGQCQVTRIDFVGPRLQYVEGQNPDGTTVTFENGVRQVSYDPEPPVWASHVGDPARVCLISIPQDCPPGDDRGRVYETTNLRTEARWRLPDSSHECGGA